MSDTLYLAGTRSNLLSIALSVTATPAAATSYPVTNLYDADPGRPFWFNAAASNSNVVADLQQLVNGDFETGTLTGWTDASGSGGSTALEVGTVHGGAKALKCLTAGAGYGLRYQVVPVRCGMTAQLSAWMCADGGGTARVRVKDFVTGLYLQSNGTWGALTDCLTSTAAAYEQKSVTFTVPGFSSSVYEHLDYITVECYCQTAGNGYFDDALLVPGVDFLSIHGHNLRSVASYTTVAGAAVYPILASSPDNAVWTDRITLATIHRARMWGRDTAVRYARYWRIRFEGQSYKALLLGEAVIGEAGTLTTAPTTPWTVELRMPQARAVTRAGRVVATNLSAHAPRRLTLPYSHRTETAWREWEHELGWRTGWGRDALVVVPDSSDASSVHHGHIEATAQMRRSHLGGHISTVSLVLDEDPFPVEGV